MSAICASVAIPDASAVFKAKSNSICAIFNDCFLDEVAMFDDTLSSSTVTNIYNSGSPNDLSSLDYLIGYWRNGDTAGPSVFPTIDDNSSNSNDGTMTNMASGDIVTDVP